VRVVSDEFLKIEFPKFSKNFHTTSADLEDSARDARRTPELRLWSRGHLNAHEGRKTGNTHDAVV
jgi:hypothetical protein